MNTAKAETRLEKIKRLQHGANIKVLRMYRLLGRKKK